ncbi:MAG TPA: tetratricopeptide repeat protein [Anaeromyxobacteraceae bacterium]|nr:tetratricopeptide repeat protein [Anaeromyxobacteraceae bacterium]
MAPALPPTVEKYQRILLADPRSRIFVELARALLEGGEPAQVLEVCERGLSHHPDSIQARILAARALLALGRGDEAVVRFEEAVAADPGNPLSCDLAGEALIAAGLAAHALPLLERAAAQHPGDLRIRQRLAEAISACGVSASTAPTLSRVPSPTPSPRPSPPAGERERETATANHSTVRLPAPPPLRRPPTPVPVAPAGLLSLLPDPDAPAAPARAAAPPEDEKSSGLLALLPELSAPAHGGDAAPGREAPRSREASPNSAIMRRWPRDDDDEANEAARTYEHELRTKLLAETEHAHGRWRRHRRTLAAAAVVLALAGGAATFLAVRTNRRAGEARTAVDAARKGLARDTVGALREASRVLATARAVLPDDAAAAALTVEVDGLLARDHGDAAARGRVKELLAAGRGGEGALAGQWLVAEHGEERAAAEALVEGARRATPLSQALAGEVLLSRREHASARPLLEAAARAQPPLLRALTSIGDLELARGDVSAALERYQLVLRAQRNHPRAALGEAEIRLRSGEDLPGALRALEAVDADPDSQPPLAERLRFDLILSRLLAAAGRTGDADRRLALAAARHPEEPRVAAAQADVLARAGDLDRALRAAEGAARLAPGEQVYRELHGHLLLRSGRYRELLASTSSAPTRALRLDRGIARLRLGEPDAARAELEGTSREGKMTPEAAAWMALAELASGRRAQAAAIVAALLAAPTPHPVALLARGRLDLAERKPAEAERRFRAAAERAPELTEARVDLGRLLRERGRGAEARPVLEQAVARDPHHPLARLELGRARLATGDAAGAARDLEAALADRPQDAGGLTALAQAQLAAGRPADARRAGDRAVAADPRSGAAALAAGQAAQAQGDTAAARELLRRAQKLLGKSPAAAEARQALASLGKRR